MGEKGIAFYHCKILIVMMDGFVTGGQRSVNVYGCRLLAVGEA